MPVYNIIIAGIGGQGVITVGSYLKKAALKAGIHVSGSERRGGAQREGHVSSIVRYQWTEKEDAHDERHEVCSPLIPAGGADLLIGLEPIEALRVSRSLNEESTVIVNLFPLPPICVRLGEAEYPDKASILNMFRKAASAIYAWNLTEIAENTFGQIHAINAMALGIASRVSQMPVGESHLLEVLSEEGRPEELDYFRLGVELVNDRR